MNTNNSIMVDDFVSVVRNTLRGFCRVTLPSGMVLSEVAIHKSGDGAWASPSSKPMLDRDGHALRDTTGKIKYTQVIGFTRRELRDKFSAGVIEALQTSHPEALK